MKRSATVASFILITTLAFATAKVQSRSPVAQPFWHNLGPGPHAVGFRVLYSRDHRRLWLNEQGKKNVDPGRPIRISVWYPALPDPSAEPMRYGDYLSHHGPNDFQRINEQLDKNDRESWLSDLNELSPPGSLVYEKLIALPMAAYRDARAAAGHFPLVLYSGGKGSRADANVELGEYLASYGYVVATVPQLGPSVDAVELGSSPEDIGLHADDFDAAMAALHNIPDIDFSHIATAGHSAGGEVAVDLALRHADVSAVVGLDGSYGMSGGTRVLRSLPEYEAGRRVNAALLDLRRANGSQGVKLDLRAIDGLQWKDLYRITFAKAFHGDFTEWGIVGLKLGIPMPPNPDAHTRQIGYQVNHQVCHAVLAFLDSELRDHKNGWKRLTTEMQYYPEAKLTHVSETRNASPRGRSSNPQ